MEGINVWLLYLEWPGVLVLGIISLLAIGLLIVGKGEAARRTIAAGLLSLTVAAALVALSSLEEGDKVGGKPMIGLAALALLLAGGGQLIAARGNPWTFAAALGAAVSSSVFTIAGLVAGNRLMFPVASLLLALGSLMIGVIGGVVVAKRDRRRLHSVLEAWDGEDVNRAEPGSSAARPRD